MLESSTYDPNYNSEIIDLGKDYIEVPDVDDVLIKDPAVFMNRLNNISSPRERLSILIKDTLNPWSDETHEAVYIRGMGLAGLGFGWLFGGIFRSRDMHDQYRRRHNAAVFDHQFLASRQAIDDFLYSIFRRGMRHGLGSALLCSSAGFIAFGSISYRAKLYYPDWMIGFATLGAVSRLWLGPKAMAAGSAIGLFAGCIGYGIACGFELVSDKSVTQLRYLNHTDYLRRREAKLAHIRRLQEQTHIDMYTRAGG